MKRIWISLVAAALLTMAVILPAAAQETATINMQEIDGSGQSGSADITSDGDQVIVSIEITPGPDGEPQPVHIHDGTCQDLGDVAYPLEDVVDGVSESTADVALIDLIRGGFAINVHLSEAEMDVYVACGNIPHIPGPDTDADADEEAAEEDDAEATEDDDATVDEDEDAVAEDDATDEADDADAADDATDEDEEATDEDEDAEDLLPATGSIGVDSGSAALLMTLFGGAALGAGLLVRRRFSIQS